MRIVEARVHALEIPFVEAFAHSTKHRAFSDAFVVRLVADDGSTGYGEGLARDYVTGETAPASIDYIKNRLFPVLFETAFPEIEVKPNALDSLAPACELLPHESSGEIFWHAARAAVETALIDCLLRRRRLSLASILPPRRAFVVYGGAITSGSVEKAVRHALRFKLFGIKDLKIKIGDVAGVERLAAVRRAVGDDFSLRVDANGAHTPDEAAAVAAEIARFRVDAFEQPFPPATAVDVAARVNAQSPIPLMADESLVTTVDAARLAAARAFDFFNLRVAKCGGLFNALKIAEIAHRYGIRLQIGCQVGETAILSAAGRHLAAHLAEARFVEGSYGSLLLAEDVSRQAINFGHGGRAPLLRGPGLGVEIEDGTLEKYSASIDGRVRKETINA